MTTVITKNLLETENLASLILPKLSKKLKKATVFGLYGNLGSGKTSFVKGIGKSFNLKCSITSPTFVIEKIYKLKNSYFENLIHIDAYRLKKGEELMVLGWKDLLKNPKNLIFIEWSENVSEILPKDIEKIEFKVIDENSREIVSTLDLY